MTEKQPIYFLPENIERTIGKDAQRNNILAAKLVSEAVKTTLGPKGMDKMLVDSLGNITITNDGVTILEQMEIEHPAAKMMVEIAKTQEKEVGDGTTSAVMLAGKLLENAEKLLEMKIHPTIITKGYSLAAEKSKEFLKELSVTVDSESEDILKSIAITAMTGKGAEPVKEKFAKIIVKAIKKIKHEGNINLKNIKIIKNKSYGIEDTKLIEGIIIDKEKLSIDMPKKIINPKIALISDSLELKNPEIEAKISITDPGQLQEFLKRDEFMLKKIVNKIKEIGANVLFCQKGIDDLVQHYLSKEKIYACRRVARSDMESLAHVTGAKIISNLNDLSEKELGVSEIVEEIKNGEDIMTYVRGNENSKALTILLHGGSEHVIDEMERSLKDGLGDIVSVIETKKIVAGAGAIEMELSKKLKEFANSVSGREQLAIKAFAESLEFIPLTLAENAGLDQIDVLTELKSRHDNNEKFAGINIFNNKIENVLEKGIIEPKRIKEQAISSASEVAVMILRIDDVLSSKNNSKGSGNHANYPNFSGMD